MTQSLRWIFLSWLLVSCNQSTVTSEGLREHNSAGAFRAVESQTPKSAQAPSGLSRTEASSPAASPRVDSEAPQKDVPEKNSEDAPTTSRADSLYEAVTGEPPPPASSRRSSDGILFFGGIALGVAAIAILLNTVFEPQEPSVSPHPGESANEAVETLDADTVSEDQGPTVSLR